ncbi:MAG: hypothetical protein CM15mP49_10110 [Actinomycetota bacterium]|nr:MAG: hypothetical protein CM15mP49_10110 [Actinomycetota bacterium]
MVPERQLMEINLSEDALPWERIGFDIVTQNSTQSTLVGRTKLCLRKLIPLKAYPLFMLRESKERGFAYFNPTTLSAGKSKRPFIPTE